MNNAACMNPSPERPTNLDVLLDVPVNLSVELGSRQIAMGEVLQLNVGAVIQLDKSADEPVAIYVNQKLLARGAVVMVDDKLGIKITELFGKQG